MAAGALWQDRVSRRILLRARELSLARLAGIGGIFAASVLVGFVLGLVASNRTGNSLWAIVGFFTGLLLGGLGAARELSRALRS